MLLDTYYDCAYCGDRNDTTVDPSAGSRQEYVEDCQTCCRPNVLRIEIDFDELGESNAYVDAQREGGD